MRAVVEVSAGVFIAASRRDVTTSTLIVRDRRVTLVDPAWDPDELEQLADLIEARGWTVSAGVATHAHHDHLLWHPRFGDVPRYASATAVTLARRHRMELLGNLGPDWPADLAALVGRLTAADGGVPFDEPIELVEHDGHAPGHCAVWLPHRAVLLAGDMLSDVELPLPLCPDDLPSYLAGLDRLEPFVRRARVLVPGHGHPTTDPMARLAADRRYLDEVARTGHSADPRLGNPGMRAVHARIQALMAAR